MLHTFMTSCLRKLARVSLAVSNFIDCFQSQNIKHRTTHTHTHNRLTAFGPDNPGRPVPEETLTHSHPS